MRLHIPGYIGLVVITLDNFKNYRCRRPCAKPLSPKANDWQGLLDTSCLFIISRLGNSEIDTLEKLLALDNKLLDEAVYFYAMFLWEFSQPLTAGKIDILQVHYRESPVVTQQMINACHNQVDIYLSASGLRDVSCWIDTREAL